MVMWPDVQGLAVPKLHDMSRYAEGLAKIDDIFINGVAHGKVLVGILWKHRLG